MKGVQEKTRNAGGKNAGAPVGIMADSHGQVEAMLTAVTYFRRMGCERVVHLGDICDSLLPDASDACVKLLQSEGVTALKGNNDHTLVVNRPDAAGACVAPETIDYLDRLPMRTQDEEAIFTHSLPFEKELGLSCMVRTPGENESIWFFEACPDKVLFRGHSHEPEIKWRQNGRIVAEPIAPGSRVALNERRPCIVTCGALTKGLCMIWRPDTGVIECFSLPPQYLKGVYHGHAA